MTKKEGSHQNTPKTAAGQAVARAAQRTWSSPIAGQGSTALLWRQTLWGIGMALTAFMLARCELLFGARPLGIALLCAATHAIP